MVPKLPKKEEKSSNIGWETWMKYHKGRKEDMTCPYIGVSIFDLRKYR
jgi:hypothetical protein